MKFCGRCGNTLQDNMNVCPNCGMVSETVPSSGNPAPNMGAQQVPPQQMPPQQVPPQQVPPQQVPPQQVPPQQVPPQQVPPQQIPYQQTPAQQMPPQQIPYRQAPPQQTPPQMQRPAAPKAPRKPIFTNKGVFGIPYKFVAIGAGALLTIIVAVIVISCVACSGGYKSAVNNYESFMNGKISEKMLQKLAPEECWELHEEYEDMDLEETAEKLLEQYEENTMYGIDQEDIKYNFKIKKAKKQKENRLAEIREALRDEYDISKKDVTAAYKLDLFVSVKFDIDFADRYYLSDAEDLLENGYDWDMYAVKIRGDWYLINNYFEFLDLA